MKVVTPCLIIRVAAKDVLAITGSPIAAAAATAAVEWHTTDAADAGLLLV